MSRIGFKVLGMVRIAARFYFHWRTSKRTCIKIPIAVSFFFFLLLPPEREISNQNVKRSVESFAFKNYWLGVARNSSHSSSSEVGFQSTVFHRYFSIKKKKRKTKKSLLQFFTQTLAIANAKDLQERTITARNNNRAILRKKYSAIPSSATWNTAICSRVPWNCDSWSDAISRCQSNRTH